MNTKITRLYWTVSLWMILSQSFFFATYQMFLVHHGLSLMQINLTNFAFMLANFLLEIPTGAYADTFGRRKSVALGCLIMCASFLMYFFSDSFWFFMGAEVIGALGMTLISGALEAWMVDALKFHGYTDKLEPIYQKEGFFRLVGLMVGSFVGSWFGNIDLAWPWIFSAIGMMSLGLYVLCKLREDYFRPQPFAWSLKPIQKIAGESIQYGWKHKGIMYIIAFSSILLLSFQSFNMQWPIIFTDYGLSINQLGWLFNGIALATYLGNLLATRIGRAVGNEKRTLIISQVITAVGMILTAVLSGFNSVLIWFLVHEVGRGTFRPLKQAYLNRRIDSDKRATVLSFDAMINQLGCALGLILSGWLADAWSIKTAWLVSAIIVAVSIPVFYRLKNGD